MYRTVIDKTYGRDASYSLTISTNTASLFRICHDTYSGGKLSAESVRCISQIIPDYYSFFILRDGIRVYPEKEFSISEETILEIANNDPRGLFNRQLRQDHSPYETKQTVYVSQLGCDIAGQTIVAGLLCDLNNRLTADEDNTCYRILSEMKRFYESFSTSGTITEMLARSDSWQFIISRNENEIIFTDEPLSDKIDSAQSADSHQIAMDLVNAILTADDSAESISRSQTKLENLKMTDFRLVDSDYQLISFRLKETEDAPDKDESLIKDFSHKMKNRLGALKTAVSQLSLQGGEIIGEDDLSLLGIIESTADSATDIVDRYSLHQTTHKKDNKPINLVDIVSQLITNCRHNTKFESDIRLGSNESSIMIDADEKQISLAITELLNNAALSGGDCGPIWIKIEKTFDTIQLCVENILEPDNRHKIAAESLLEPFVSTRKSAAGLGLPIAQKIFNDHGGTMTIDNSSSTCFTVTVTFPELKTHKARRSV